MDYREFLACFDLMAERLRGDFRLLPPFLGPRVRYLRSTTGFCLRFRRLWYPQHRQFFPSGAILVLHLPGVGRYRWSSTCSVGLPPDCVRLSARGA